jgi:hypothetical protein
MLPLRCGTPEGVPNSLVGIRDRALLLVGFAAALRRSELVALRVEDVQFVAQGMLLTIDGSKTDQEGADCKRFGRQKNCVLLQYKDPRFRHDPSSRRPRPRYGRCCAGGNPTANLELRERPFWSDYALNKNHAAAAHFGGH